MARATTHSRKRHDRIYIFASIFGVVGAIFLQQSYAARNDGFLDFGTYAVKQLKDYRGGAFSTSLSPRYKYCLAEFTSGQSKFISSEPANILMPLAASRPNQLCFSTSDAYDNVRIHIHGGSADTLKLVVSSR